MDDGRGKQQSKGFIGEESYWWVWCVAALEREYNKLLLPVRSSQLPNNDGPSRDLSLVWKYLKRGRNLINFYGV